MKLRKRPDECFEWIDCIVIYYWTSAILYATVDCNVVFYRRLR